MVATICTCTTLDAQAHAVIRHVHGDDARDAGMQSERTIDD